MPTPTLNELIETANYKLIKEELSKAAIPDEKSFDLALKTRRDFIIDLLIDSGALPSDKSFGLIFEYGLASNGYLASKVTSYVAKKIPLSSTYLDFALERNLNHIIEILLNEKCPISYKSLDIALQNECLEWIVLRILRAGAFITPDTFASVIKLKNISILEEVLGAAIKQKYFQIKPENFWDVMRRLFALNIEPKILTAFLQTLSDNILEDKAFIGNNTPYRYDEKIIAAIDALAFLSQKPALRFQNINALAVVKELILVLDMPHKIDQGNENLCAVATFLSALATKSPKLFVQIALQCATTEKLNHPIKLVSTEQAQREEESIVQAMMLGIRNAYNNIPFTRSSLFKKLSAYSLPQEVCHWLMACGFTNVVSYPLKSKLTHPFLYIGNMKYDVEQKPIVDIRETLTEANNRLGNNDCVLMGTSMALCAAIVTKYNSDGVQMIRMEVNTSLFVPDAHLVGIQTLNESDEKVSIVMHTYGAEYSNSVDLKTFEKGCLGFIAATPPKYELDLQKTRDKKREATLSVVDRHETKKELDNAAIDKPELKEESKTEVLDNVALDKLEIKEELENNVIVVNKTMAIGPN